MDDADDEAVLAPPDGTTEIRYYGRLLPGGVEPVLVVRVRVTDGEMVEEALGPDLGWRPSDYLRTFHVGRDPGDHVKITASQAAAFVRRSRASPG